MATIQGQSTTNASSISQKAAIAALNGPETDVQKMNAAFKERHDFFVAGLNALPGFSCLPASGTFYAFVDVHQAMQQLGFRDDNAFAEFILAEALVAGVAGSGFGAPGFFRIAYCVDKEMIVNSLPSWRELAKEAGINK